AGHDQRRHPRDWEDPRRNAADGTWLPCPRSGSGCRGRKVCRQGARTPCRHRRRLGAPDYHHAQSEGVVEALENAGLRSQVKVMVGGAPVTRRWAVEIGADGYAKDAMSAVTLARELMAQKTQRAGVGPA